MCNVRTRNSEKMTVVAKPFSYDFLYTCFQSNTCFSTMFELFTKRTENLGQIRGVMSEVYFMHGSNSKGLKEIDLPFHFRYLEHVYFFAHLKYFGLLFEAFLDLKAQERKLLGNRHTR